MDVACSTHVGEQRCIQGLVEKSEGKSPLGGPRRRWEDNIKVYMGWRVDCIDLVHDGGKGTLL